MEPLHPATEGRPIYLRVADAVTRSVLSGEFPPGARLPGRNFVCAHYGVSAMTVTNAYNELARRGVVTIRQGDGTKVAAEALNVLQGSQVSELRMQVAALTERVDRLTEQLDILVRERPPGRPVVPAQRRKRRT